MTTRTQSLGTRVLRHVMVPLALTWLAGTVVALGIAARFTETAFDRALLDDAYLMASNVRVENGALSFALSERELNTALFDYAESMYFRVDTGDGKLVAGDASLPRPDAAVAPGFEDIVHNGFKLRAVVLRREQPQPFSVVVAATTNSRATVVQQLLVYSLIPQALLLALLAWWLRRGVRADMEPLARLREAVDNRGAGDMAPVPVQATTLEVEHLAAAINSFLARLERSARAQREFAGNVAHELRTPLAGIRALADYGLAQKDPAAWREQLQRIASSQARASRLVDQLLQLAVAQEAEAGLQIGPVALDSLVRDAVLRFLPRADAAGIDLGARGIDMPAHVAGDATLIEGILNNLLDNALRYGVDGAHGPPAVTVALEHQPEGVLMSVQDNGSGLPGELQDQLIARGAQGESGQLLGQGAGLGLALVSQYARLMGARMELGSGPDGQGWMCSILFARVAPSR